MSAHRIFSQIGIWRGAFVCAWALAGMAAARGQTVEEFNKTAAEKMKVYDRAGVIAACNSSLALDPKQAAVLNIRGIVEMDNREFPAALDDFNRAIGIDPKFTKAYINRAIIEDGKGDEKAADADFKRAIALDAKATYIARGTLEFNKGDDGKALAYFERAIQIDPKSAEAWFERGSVKVDKGDPEGAVTDLSRAIELDPKNGSYYEWRGCVEAGIGDNEAGAVDAKRAKDLAPRPLGEPTGSTGSPTPAHKPGPAPADQSAALRITLDIHPELGENADIRKIANASGVLDYSDPDAHFCVVVENISSKPVVLEPSRIQVPYFEITDEKGAVFSVCRPQPGADTTPIGPVFELGPKEKAVIEIPYVVPDVRRNQGPMPRYPFPYPAPGTRRKVTIRAVLQFKPGPDAGKELANYWTGRIVSEPCKVTLVGADQPDKPRK